MVQRSIVGWQFILSVYPLVNDLANRFLDIVREDNIHSLQKYLHENCLTPLVHDKDGSNLLHIAMFLDSLEITK